MDKAHQVADTNPFKSIHTIQLSNLAIEISNLLSKIFGLNSLVF